jgi:HlyD family secretion protein
MNTRLLTSSLPLLAILTATAHAGDLTLEARPFTVSSEFECTAIPAAAEAITIGAEKWADFTVETILDHGSVVKKGDVLVQFKSKALGHALEDQGREVQKAKLALDDANSALAAATAELPINLAAARATYQRVADDVERFTKVNRPAQEKDARKDLEISQFRLKSAQEELNQLEKMYAADDLTEETEEFILERQKKSVEMAEFSLEKQQLATDQMLGVSLPRQAEDYARGLKQAKIALDRAEAELPRALERAKIEAAAATAAHQRATADLKDLQADSAKLTLKAPVDGRFYHGVFRDGKWVTGDLVKGLVKGGKVGTVRPFATVVPDGAELQFMARVNQDAVRGLAKDATGKLRLQGYDERPLDATVLSVEPVPGTDGLFLVGLSTELPGDLTAAPGAKAKAKVQVHSNPEAIVVPKAALKDGDAGSRQVEVLLADGETERRDVQIGRSNGDDLEILSGLEAGQKIVVPEKK